MAHTKQVLDRWGNPVRRAELAKHEEPSMIGGVRSPLTGYPGDGLNPERLASILREADAGDPIRYLELAETIEERDLHYLGVLGTRRRSVSQLDITVEPSDDSDLAEQIAERVRTWLKRDELTEELFDILDALGKGYSFTHIRWDTSEGQFEPAALEYCDPRWFRFDRRDLKTPRMLNPQTGEEEILPPFQYIYAPMKAKSGLPLRSGLARVALWAWLFKAFTQRDWAIFTQTYGQPLRIGKYGPGTSEEDRKTLFRAVANIAGDCAAIIPESMMIEFQEAKSIGASTDHYERRSDWLDKQTSKLVLGQTSTTDAETGGLGSGKEHRQVQEDIERADAKQLGAIINRDLIRPWVQLEYGVDAPAPRLKVGRPEEEDLASFSKALSPLVARGLRVKQSEVRAKFGLSDPGETDDVIGGKSEKTPQTSPKAAPAPTETGPAAPQSEIEGRLNVHLGVLGGVGAERAAEASEGRSAPISPEAGLAARLETDGRKAMASMLARIEAMLRASSSLEEFRETLLAGYGDLDASELHQALALADLAAHSGGRAMVEGEADG
ncbi:DUF935 domain-containing protein [Phaeobacter sp. B1627]|uniref:DUF935 domain-containing protein n=1 Tax=Phaeobacter sp. B1627 TaxID=2583809 RepID=UPI00111AB303|nr:DUF935 domain-containing protein [Phaeobacter sp. B1627]TNJ40485.1 DUF935 domain-containing protein [Phaeobacter sp. B1627]